MQLRISLTQIYSDNDHSSRVKFLTTTPQGIHLYERTSSLPRAYLVHRYLLAKSRKEALNFVSAPAFNPRLLAVTESCDQ